jgi:hypothetical protein
MIKKNNLALYTLLIVGLFSSLNLNLFAQKVATAKIDQATKPRSVEKFVMPLTVSLGNEVFADYLRVASLPVNDRRISFRNSSNDQKAGFFRVQFALQLIKRPNMTKEQQEFILDAISKITSDTYDKSDPEKVRLNEQIGQELENKAIGIFPPKEAGDILAALFGNKDEDVSLLQNYENLLTNGMRARKKLVRAMPVNDRVNIWKTQLVYHLVTGKFSKVQNEFILDFLTTITPATFERSLTETREESVKSLEVLDKKIQAVFSKSESFAIFEELGIQKIVPDDSNLAPAFCECRWTCTYGTCGASGCVMFPECGPTGTWDCTNVCNR